MWWYFDWIVAKGLLLALPTMDRRIEVKVIKQIQIQVQVQTKK